MAKILKKRFMSDDDLVSLTTMSSSIYNYPEKLDEFLYYIEISNINYQEAFNYFNIQHAPTLKSCSSIRKDNLYGRNYDWNYDNSITFIAKTKAIENRLASLGIVGSVPGLDKMLVESGAFDFHLFLLPFYTLDGINEAGVVCNANVVPTGDMGRTIGHEKHNMPAIMMTRYVLDYAHSADEAVELFRKNDVWMPQSKNFNQEFHWMVADKNKTYIIEYINNELNVIENHNIMTNFYLTGYDGTIDSLTPHANGIERYEILLNQYNNINSAKTMMEALQSVRFSNAYDLSKQWYSEFANNYGPDSPYGDLTKDSPKEAYSLIMERAHELYEQRSRDTALVSQTIHSSVYNLDTKELIIDTQESGKYFKESLSTKAFSFKE